MRRRHPRIREKSNTNALNEMLKRVQHDKKKYVIPNLFRNLESANDKELIAFVLVFLDKETLILYISIEL